MLHVQLDWNSANAGLSLASEAVKYLASMDSVKNWLQRIVCRPISNIYATLYEQEGVAEGAAARTSDDEEPAMQFVEEPSICETLSRELEDSSAPRVVGIWAPSGTGKTFTISSLMLKARQQEQGCIIRYERIDWSKYRDYSHGRTISQWMDFWRTVAGPKSGKSSFTVLFMDHFDDAMGTSDENNSAIEFLKEMVCKAHDEKNLAMLFCVNDLNHAKLIKYTLELCKEPDDTVNFCRMLMCCSGSHDNAGAEQQEGQCPVMMWKSREAARQYASLALCAYTATQTKKGVRLDWGVEETAEMTGKLSVMKIEKLTDLVLADGCVKRAVSFLRGDGWNRTDRSPVYIDVFMLGTKRWRKQEWEDMFHKLKGSGCSEEWRISVKQEDEDSG
jgi:hypothetical protein